MLLTLAAVVLLLIPSIVAMLTLPLPKGCVLFVASTYKASAFFSSSAVAPRPSLP